MSGLSKTKMQIQKILFSFSIKHHNTIKVIQNLNLKIKKLLLRISN